MKKIMFLALAALIMIGCVKRKPEIETHSNIVINDNCEYYIEVIAIDKHIYITMSHKGNCRFCKERRQKELKELVEQLKRKNYESENKENRRNSKYR